MLNILINIVLIFASIFDLSSAQCSVQIDTFMAGSSNYNNWPLVLHPTQSSFLPLQGQIYVGNGQDLRLACTGKGNHFVKFPNFNIITVRCLDGIRFTNPQNVNNIIYNFYQSFACQKVSY